MSEYQFPLDHRLDTFRDEWEVSPETIADRTLTQLIQDGESVHDKAHPYGQVGLRQAVDGFRGMCRQIARTHKVSFSTFVRIATKHGSAIIMTDPRMLSLIETVRDARANAMESGSRAALRRLDQVHPFDFVGTEPCRTTLSAFWWVRGELSEIADVCGIQTGKVAVIAVLASIATLPNERGYKLVVRQELDGFWEHVRRHEEISKLD